MEIRTRHYHDGRCRETVIVSPIGGAWRDVEELQRWALATFKNRCALITNGAAFTEDLGPLGRKAYEITLKDAEAA
jgi:hypothetical protein